MSVSMRTAESAAAMLHDLKKTHAEVRACIDEMETVTSNVSADRLEYTAARFRISKASMARRKCFQTVCAELSKNASSQEDTVIDRLMQADRALLAKSASHLAHWAADSIEADWRGYCAASRRIRQHMVEELEGERTFLFPLLERRSVTPARAQSRTRAA